MCTPLARATNFRFSRPRFRISGDEISLRGAPPLASARFPFGAEREPLAHHGAAAEPAPDRARARRTHGRARSRGRSARRSRGSSRGARGRDATRRTRDPSRAGHVVAALSAVSGRASRLLLTATGAHPTPTSRDGEGQVQPQDRGAGQGHDQGDAQRDGTRGGGSGRDRGDRAIGEREEERPTQGRRELGRGRGRGREHRERHVERDAT